VHESYASQLECNLLIYLSGSDNFVPLFDVSFPNHHLDRRSGIFGGLFVELFEERRFDERG